MLQTGDKCIKLLLLESYTTEIEASYTFKNWGPRGTLCQKNHAPKSKLEGIREADE